jgi:transposase
LRNRVERSFAPLKPWRRVATRYDRKPTNFLSGISIASIFIGLNVDSA